MKYFLDTEFLEDGKTIDLISIGIVCEDGRTLYCENSDFKFSKATPWLKENVLPHLWALKSGGVPDPAWTRDGGYGGLMSHSAIGAAVQIFCDPEQHGKPEFWGYCADYDWVVFCWLFGAMLDLPEGFPMFCMDIKQLCVSLGNPTLPEQSTTEHHALADALWNKRAYEFLTVDMFKAQEGEAVPA